ncbi:hypothetical protein T191209_131 [Synechococcus phage S-CAM22]|uniref:Uncharacterized protein n=1 Tax=Synechococcus phage S-CAM22 TaxID=1883365 RepID=A0A1D8KQU1_9CAUD|nr:hypothetical protein BOW88_gp100 [Synechococcus phage S-CAM22]YP_010088792.1 hypothetical protein KNT15_gp100 [Synechococcus phage S-CAM22]AOV60964.1 hypothetical protein C350210_131 [Synechococcus phage S-CAM22]AOV61178.1 hypothetical protein N440310_131 [Synechococcus phage S-CAM22]AOV61392.1 hypothetical protein T191209_131 [Synechococcus phage S-CAM22]
MCLFVVYTDIIAEDPPEWEGLGQLFM